MGALTLGFGISEYDHRHLRPDTWPSLNALSPWGKGRRKEILLGQGEGGQETKASCSLGPCLNLHVSL